MFLEFQHVVKIFIKYFSCINFPKAYRAEILFGNPGKKSEIHFERSSCSNSDADEGCKFSFSARAMSSAPTFVGLKLKKNSS